MSRLTIMLTSLFLSFTLASSAYAADAGIQMGANGNLIFEPNEVTVNVGDTVTFTNGDLPPHNVVKNTYLCVDSLTMFGYNYNL